MPSTFGNDKTTSLDFKILMNSFVVIMSLTVASLPITTLTAYAVSGLVWVDTQFSWAATLCSCWVSWGSSLYSSLLGLLTLIYFSAMYYFRWIKNSWGNSLHSSLLGLSTLIHFSAMYYFWWIKNSVFVWAIFISRWLCFLFTNGKFLSDMVNKKIVHMRRCPHDVSRILIVVSKENCIIQSPFNTSRVYELFLYTQIPGSWVITHRHNP